MYDMSDNASNLEKSLEALSKEYKSVDTTEFIRSGSVVIDALLGGGIPRGVYILWSSESGCGKSTSALHISKIYCMQGLKVLYLDFEGGVNQMQLDSMGLSEYKWSKDKNPNGPFIQFLPKTFTDAEKILDAVLKDVDLVVIDSATAMLTEKSVETSSEKATPGEISRAMSRFLIKYKADSTRQGTTWIILNQMRTKISLVGRSGLNEAGGQGLKFYSDIRLQMKKALKGTLEKIEETATGEQKVPFGAICTIYAIKNRYARPAIPLNLAIIFGKGISNSYAYFDFLMNTGKIKKTGAWFTLDFDDKKEKLQGVSKVIEWINDNKDFVRDYINSQGGYKLLMNDTNSINLGASTNLDEEAYNEDSLDGNFSLGDEASIDDVQLNSVGNNNSTGE